MATSNSNGKDSTELLNIYIDKIKQHSDVTKSLKSLQTLMTKSDANNTKWLKKFVNDDLLQHIINDMVLYKEKNKQKDYFVDLQQHILFINYLFELSEWSPIPFNIEPQSLFESFIINTNNEQQRFIMLEIFISIWRAFVDYDKLQLFYDTYFKPLMMNYADNNNYKMIINIYYCFSIYYMKTDAFNINNNDSMNNSMECLKYLNVNNIQITQFIMDELRETIETKNTLKLHHLLYTLKDILVWTEKSHRIPLINNNKLTDKMRKILRNIFDIFATTPDGSMCHNDMRRYIISSGAGINNASKTKITQIFNHQETLDFNGFCNFYKTAILRNIDYVWSDIIRFGYKYDLKSEFNINSNDNDDNDDNDDSKTMSVRDIICKDKDYWNILNKYFENQQECDNNWETFEIMIKLPKCYEIQQKMYKLEGGEQTIKFSNNLYKMIYGILMLNSIINGFNECGNDNIGNDWKRLFVEKRKLNCLCVLLLGFYMRGRNDYKYYKDHEGYQLGRSLLFKMLYFIQKSYLNKQVTINQFIHDKLAKFNGIDIFSDDEIKSILYMEKNNLLQMICLVSKKMKNRNICHLKVSKLIDLMPSKILRLYGEPLVHGYVRNYASKYKIPYDVMTLLLRFFA